MSIRSQYGVMVSFKILMEQTDLAAIASELERLQDDVVAGDI
jgi:hypothetical protein